MKKEKVIVWTLAGVILILIVLTCILYFKNVALASEREQLIQDRTQLSQEKDELISERENLRRDMESLGSELDLLKEDVASIYKGCISENACKGRYPNIRWNCNNVGDEADESLASHICVCDSSCNLNATEIRKG
jgi:uncharacterized protein YpmS